MDIREIIKHRILLLDGAMGTMLQSYGLGEKEFRGSLFSGISGQMSGNYDMLNLTQPEIIMDIHRRYLQAGADIIETNTFSSQRISQATYHLESYCYDMAQRGAQLAKSCAMEYSTADQPRFVAGSIGPTNKSCSMVVDASNPAVRDISYDELFTAYTEQIKGLVDGGVDLLLIETIFDTLNAKAAIDACITEMEVRRCTLPLMLSVTITDGADRTLSGQTLEAFLASISTYPIFSVGLNCSFGVLQMKPYIRLLAHKAPYYISIYPNAGLPDEMGQYDEDIELMVSQMADFIAEGLVNIIGGCCGTNDHFIEKLALLTKEKVPHEKAPAVPYMQLSGLEELLLTPNINFINVGERCNVVENKNFLRLIQSKAYEEALTIARKQVENGVSVLSINMDEAFLDAKNEMVNFINMIASEPDIARVPIMIDSSNWDVIVAGLKCVQGKCIINSISLKEGEEMFLKYARDVKRYGAACVVACFDEIGQAASFERRTAIAARAYHLLLDKIGMNPLDIVIDPNMLPVATGIEEHNSYAIDFIRTTAWINRNLPGAHVCGRISNLSVSFKENDYIREAMHAVFLYHNAKHGMDFGVVNPETTVIYSNISQDELEIIEDVILNRHSHADNNNHAVERLIRLAEKYQGRTRNP